MEANSTQADIDELAQDAKAAMNSATNLGKNKVCSGLGYELFTLRDDILKLEEQNGRVNSDNRAAWEYRTSKTSDKPTRKEYDAWIKAAQSEGLDVSDLKFEKCGKADFRYPTIP